jgi:hypothetical protein
MSTADPPAQPDDDGIERARAHRVPPGGDRPDWLVGADEGAAAEAARGTTPPGERPALKLHRPGEDDGAANDVPIGLPLSSRAAAERKKKVVPWSAAASSVPSLRTDRSVEGTSASLGRDLGDLPETPPLERVVTTATGRREGPPPSRRETPALPKTRAAGPATARPLAAVPPLDDAYARDFEADAGLDEDEAPDVFETPRPALRPALPPPRDGWWMVALDELRHNRRLQILAACAVVAVAAFVFWPRSEPGVSLGEIRRHPERYDGARVRVSGRIGQVYQVGGSYAFYLHQGRDTMVVFTRTRVPEPRKKVTLSASVSTGFLDGLPRQSLFEEAP